MQPGDRATHLLGRSVRRVAGDGHPGRSRRGLTLNARATTISAARVTNPSAVSATLPAALRWSRITTMAHIAIVAATTKHPRHAHRPTSDAGTRAVIGVTAINAMRAWNTSSSSGERNHPGCRCAVRGREPLPDHGDLDTERRMGIRSDDRDDGDREQERDDNAGLRSRGERRDRRSAGNAAQRRRDEQPSLARDEPQAVDPHLHLTDVHRCSIRGPVDRWEMSRMTWSRLPGPCHWITGIPAARTARSSRRRSRRRMRHASSMY